MIQTILERKPLSKTRNADAEFIKKEFDFHDNSNMTNKIRQKRQMYVKALLPLGIADLKSKSLSELKGLLDTNKIEITSKRKMDWKKHENDVTDGINQLFKHGFFTLKTSNSQSELKDNENFKAELAGGATQSDVKVTHGNKSFFIECKLNFEAAEYFKYGLKISKNVIKYDHQKYKDGLDDIADKEQIDKIDQLFNKEINLDSFLNKIVNDSSVKASWNQFLKNAVGVEEFIIKSPEFKDFTSKVKFSQVWPDDFSNFVKVFDTYSNYYIRKYDQLIDQLFQYFDSDDLEIEDYQIQKHDRNGQKNVMSSLEQLMNEIENLGLQIYNKKAFDKTIVQIQVIETKFNALLSTLGYENDISKIKKLKDKEKTKYFFKMFISSVGRKSKDAEYNSLATEDELGNMQICSAIPIKTDELAKLITAFYVKKDNCAYVQIADTVYQFEQSFNPLQLPNLPLFKECMTSFNVIINVSDDLKRIGLHIKADEPDKSKFNGKNIVSFKENDANYIAKILDDITISV